MADDIVERLRTEKEYCEACNLYPCTKKVGMSDVDATPADCDCECHDLQRAAADEIERLRLIVGWFVEDRDEDFIDVGDWDWRPEHTRPWIAYDGIGVDKEIPDEVIESFREYRRG